MSLSLDMTVLFSNATTIVQSLWPILGISVGFTLGFGILAMILNAVKGAVKH